MGILSRQDEVAATAKKGRRSAEVIQTNVFDDVFHEGPNARVQPDQVNPEDLPRSYGRACSLHAILQHQEAILKEMHAVQQRGSTEINPEKDVGKAVLHNLQLEDLPDALRVLAHVPEL